MKFCIFIYCLMLLSFPSVCQDHFLFATDSLIKQCRVKKRTKEFTSEKNAGYHVDHFDTSGNLIKAEVISAYSDNAMITTDYFYDSLGRRYASVANTAGFNTGSNGFFDVMGERYIRLTNYYQYNKDGKLKRTWLMDSLNKKIKSECLYSYNPFINDSKWYDKNGKLIKEKIDLFEKGNFIVSSAIKTYDTTGVLLSNVETSYINTFNANGQLINTKFSSPDCSSMISYEYYENGLVKRKSGDNCLFDWKFTYKYY